MCKFGYKYILYIFLFTTLCCNLSLQASESIHIEDNIQLFMNDISTKKTFIKYWVNYLTSDKEDANAYFRLFRIDNKKTNTCLGFVFFIETITSDIILIPAMKKDVADNGIIASELLTIVSSYTGYDTFLILESFFNNKVFSSYSNHKNYLQKQSHSSLYAKVKAKDMDISDYSVESLEEDIPLFLRISSSILKGANTNIKDQLTHIRSFGLLTHETVQQLEEKILLYKNYDVNHNLLYPSILDYIEASICLEETITNTSDSTTTTTSNDASQTKPVLSSSDNIEIPSNSIFPISRFYVDLLTKTDISSSLTYKMFKKKFFNTETLTRKLFNFTEPSVGIEILDQILSNLPYKPMSYFKNSMIVFDGMHILSYVIDRKTSYVIDSKYSDALLFKLYTKPKFDIEIENAEKFLSSYYEDISERLYSTLSAKKSILRRLILDSDNVSTIVIRTILTIYSNISQSFNLLDIELLSYFLDALLDRTNTDLSASDILFIINKLDIITTNKIKTLGKTRYQEVRDLLIKIADLKSQLLKMDSTYLKCINFFIP